MSLFLLGIYRVDMKHYPTFEQVQWQTVSFNLHNILYLNTHSIWFSKFIALDHNWRYQCLWSTKWAMELHFPVSFSIKLISTRSKAKIKLNIWIIDYDPNVHSQKLRKQLLYFLMTGTKDT